MDDASANPLPLQANDLLNKAEVKIPASYHLSKTTASHQSGAASAKTKLPITHLMGPPKITKKKKKKFMGDSIFLSATNIRS